MDLSPLQGDQEKYSKNNGKPNGKMRLGPQIDFTSQISSPMGEPTSQQWNNLHYSVIQRDLLAGHLPPDKWCAHVRATYVNLYVRLMEVMLFRLLVLNAHIVFYLV